MNLREHSVCGSVSQLYEEVGEVPPCQPPHLHSFANKRVRCQCGANVWPDGSVDEEEEAAKLIAWQAWQAARGPALELDRAEFDAWWSGR